MYGPSWCTTALFVGLTLGRVFAPCDRGRGCFFVDSSVSRLDLSGTFVVELEPQDDDGLSFSTAYRGTITVDVDDVENPTYIEFLTASLEALESGHWLPQSGGGSLGQKDVAGDSDPGEAQPANYGMFADTQVAGVAWGAFRGLVYTIVSEFNEPSDVLDGRFDSTAFFVVAEGTLDANVQSAQLGDDANSQDVMVRDMIFRRSEVFNLRPAAFPGEKKCILPFTRHYYNSLNE